MTSHLPIEATCPTCKAAILELPDDTGTTRAYDELPSDLVDQHDRLIWLGSRGVWPLPHDGPQPSTCLRRHQCNRSHPPDAPPPAAVSPPAPLPAERADYTALRTLRTQIELYRAQHLGRLRPHPGSRTYDRVTPNSRLATIGNLTATCCALCRHPFTSDERPLTVGLVDGASDQPVLVCTPGCGRHPR